MLTLIDENVVRALLFVGANESQPTVDFV